MQLDRLSANRMALDDLIMRHPEVLERPIESPVIIAGLPRSGTTVLYRSLAEDPSLRPIPLWEALYPFTSGSCIGENAGVDLTPVRRRRLASVAVTRAGRHRPGNRHRHAAGPDLPEEDAHFAALDDPRCERMLAMLLATDEANRALPFLRPGRASFLHTVLQALQWRDTSRRWQLKNPAHVLSLPELGSVFPTATVIVLHRSPADAAASLARLLHGVMLSSQTVLSGPLPSPKEIGRLAVSTVITVAAACERAGSADQGLRGIHLRYSDLLADPARILNAVAQAWDLPQGDYAGIARMQRHRSAVAELPPDFFGIDLVALREQSAGYLAFMDALPPARPR